MAAHEITVQDCGCLALPHDLATQLGIGPGSVLSLDQIDAGQVVITRLSPPAPSTQITPKAACPLP